MKKATIPEKDFQPLSEIEKKILESLKNITFLPGCFDKRFCNGLTEDAKLTEKQKKYLHFVFNKYRRQIKNYENLAFELEPDRFKVDINFNGELFDLKSSANVSFKDTFKPSRFVKS